MKNLLFTILITALLTACAGKSTGTDNTQVTETAIANKTVTLAVEGMTCSGCENTVKEAVSKINGIASIKASHLDSTAIVSFDSTLVSTVLIGEAITEAGYVFKGEKTK